MKSKEFKERLINATKNKCGFVTNAQAKKILAGRKKAQEAAAQEAAAQEANKD
jgi:hypothetical protein